MSAKIDLTGKKFGKLLVIETCGVARSGHLKWKCLCDCGNFTESLSCDLRCEKSKSCGCTFIEKTRIGAINASWKSMHRIYRMGAKQREYEFHLTIDDFISICSKNCHYCNEPPKENNTYYKLQIKKVKSVDLAYYDKYIIKFNGIDRKDNDKEYTLENSLPCCGFCNIMKMDKSYKDFLDHVKKIFNYSLEVKNDKEAKE